MKIEDRILNRLAKQIDAQHTSNLKLAAIICCTLLGFVTIVGIFWGKEGIGNLGIGLAILVGIVGMIVLTSNSDYGTI